MKKSKFQIMGALFALALTMPGVSYARDSVRYVGEGRYACSGSSSARCAGVSEHNRSMTQSNLDRYDAKRDAARSELREKRERRKRGY